MRALTRTVLAADALDRWENQHRSKDEDYRFADGRKKADVHTALKALGPSPAPDDVDAVMGNGSWTKVHECDVCGGHPAAVIEIDIACDVGAAFVCINCLQVASEMLTTAL